MDNNIVMLADALSDYKKDFRGKLLLLMDSLPSDIPEEINDKLWNLACETDNLIPLSPLVSKELEKEQEEWIDSYLNNTACRDTNYLPNIVSEIKKWAIENN
jgi:hypothetical protein